MNKYCPLSCLLGLLGKQANNWGVPAPLSIRDWSGRALTDAIEALHAIVVSDTANDNAKISASDALLRHGIRYLEISNLLERLNRLENQIGGDIDAV